MYFNSWILNVSSQTTGSGLNDVRVLRYNIREARVCISSLLINTLLYLLLFSSVAFKRMLRYWPDRKGILLPHLCSLWLHPLATSPSRHFTSFSLHPFATSPLRHFTSLSLHLLVTSPSRLTSSLCHFISLSLHLFVTSPSCHFTFFHFTSS